MQDNSLVRELLFTIASLYEDIKPYEVQKAYDEIIENLEKITDPEEICDFIHKNPKFIRYLIFRNKVNDLLDVNAKKENGDTALHEAAWNGHADVIRALVKLGADLKVQDKGDNTALHLAAWYGHVDAVKALAELGADLKVQDKYGRTALDLAASQGHAEIVNLLSAQERRERLKKIAFSASLLLIAALTVTAVSKYAFSDQQ